MAMPDVAASNSCGKIEAVRGRANGRPITASAAVETP